MIRRWRKASYDLPSLRRSFPFPKDQKRKEKKKKNHPRILPLPRLSVREMAGWSLTSDSRSGAHTKGNLAEDRNEAFGLQFRGKKFMTSRTRRREDGAGRDLCSPWDLEPQRQAPWTSPSLSAGPQSTKTTAVSPSRPQRSGCMSGRGRGAAPYDPQQHSYRAARGQARATNVLVTITQTVAGLAGPWGVG